MTALWGTAGVVHIKAVTKSLCVLTDSQTIKTEMNAHTCSVLRPMHEQKNGSLAGAGTHHSRPRKNVFSLYGIVWQRSTCDEIELISLFGVRAAFIRALTEHNCWPIALQHVKSQRFRKWFGVLNC